jgi:DNA-binding response OmpR family regulator
MTKRVLDVGNCDPDHSSITRLLQQNFAVDVVRVHNQAGAMSELEKSGFDLVLVNRLMDKDGSSGLEIIKAMKTGASAETPVMMITNFPDHQALAVAAGAEPGFGKAALSSSETLSLLTKYLG